MAEREGVKVYIGWEDSDTEWSAGEVPLTELTGLPNEVYGLFDATDPSVGGVRGGLVYDETATVPLVYRLILERK
jgi:hypothetical protein